MIKILKAGLLLLSVQYILSDLEQTIAQVVPDRSLGDESSQARRGEGLNELRIDGGATRGGNLFHSFSEFNVLEGQSVYFRISPSIAHIFSRITGDNPSNILGKLGIQGGNANLFFLNPNGILFGPNATLDLKGSFSATTANHVVFQDNSFFSTSNSPPTLLTSSIPIGLGFTSPTGKIQVIGTGHTLIQLPIAETPNQSLQPLKLGLSVQSGRTLALSASKIEFVGGILTSPSGNIAIASLDSGEVKINWSDVSLFSINYQTSNPNDITLARLSLLNASGTEHGNIQVFGKNITLTDSSTIFIENQGNNPLGKIQIHATETLENLGITELSPIYPNFVRSGRGIASQAIYAGKGADIDIQARNLILRSSGRIYTSQFGTGNAGDISINVKETVNILGVAPSDPNFLLGSLIASASIGNARSGSITLSSKNLTLQQGGFLSTIVLEDGVGGNVFINSDRIVVEGLNKPNLFPSLISANNQDRGIAGNVDINSKYILVENGGRIDASNLALGQAGNLTITADTIEVKGISPISNASSLITASSGIPNQVLQEGLSLPEMTRGTSGNLKIFANQILVSDGASISVAHDGRGDGGTLNINAQLIDLKDSDIVATSLTEQGGNISLIVGGDIILRENSTISATAGETGNGGNVSINARFLILDNNSSITAQAFQGRGGNLNFKVQGLLESPQSLISASSELGVDGLVLIDRSYKFEDALLIPDYDYLQVEEILDRFCNASEESKGQFQAVGAGSLPPSPNSGLNSSDSLITIPKPSPQSVQLEPTGQTVISRPEARWKGGRIVEANTRLRLLDGRIILIAVPESLNSGDLACPVSKSAPN